MANLELRGKKMGVSSSLYVGMIYGSVLSIILVGYGSLGCLEAEKVGLLKLKAAMNHPNGTALSSWGGEWDDKVNADCCRWESVTCDKKTKRVIQLDLFLIRERELGNWFLNSSLLLPFHQLRILDLSDNQLTDFQGSLRLKKLRVLNLGGNDLTSIPILSGLPSLKVLDLDSNHINSFQLREGNYSRRLEVLNLQYNSLMGSIPPFIGTFSSLKSFSLAHNHLNDSLSIQGLCKMSNLEELDVSVNEIEGNLPVCFNNLTSLRTLDLSRNNLKGTIPSSLLSSLKLLQYISLSYNNLEGSFDFTSLFNHSKLEVFQLVSGNRNLMVETESSTSQLIITNPRFQLRVFRVSNCIVNPKTRVIPSFLWNQYELRAVELSNNGIVGEAPTWLLVNNSKLESIRLSGNQLRGPLFFGGRGLNSEHASMQYLDISSNLIHGHIPNDMGSIFPKLVSLNMSGNALYGNFPPSIGDMENLYQLDLSNNNLSGRLPQHFLRGCISLATLILSNNSFHGSIPANSNLPRLSCLFLDNNRFSGKISRGLLKSSPLELLDLGNNSFSGHIPDWIGRFPNMVSLVLSRNHLKGVMPPSFCKLRQLQHLDLSWNKLGGSIPPCFNQSILKFLHLASNELTGAIPDVLSRVPSLFILDLKDNKFWGTIPTWISLLTSLRVLLLGGNELRDSIPTDLCKLRSIRIMDLSHNNLSGTIPPCLSNLTFGSKGAFQDGMFITAESTISIYATLETYSYESRIPVDHDFIDLQSDPSSEGAKVDFTTKWRFETYEGRILPIMSGMDLSWNNLRGPIPPELGDLSEMHSLNMSGNHLSGSIPETFSNLKEIESLDLSHNKLIGQIPPQLIELNRLAVFTVAYNNLSGKLPERKAQFGTFEASSYEGNPLLCGLPLNRSCSSPASPPASDSDHNEGKGLSWEGIFWWSFGGSFGVAFLGIFGFIYFNYYCRELLFYFVAKHLPFLPV